jgi:hypothetical protein
MDISDVICWLNKEHALDFIHIITKDGVPGAAVQDMVVLDYDDDNGLVLRWK